MTPIWHARAVVQTGTHRTIGPITATRGSRSFPEHRAQMRLSWKFTVGACVIAALRLKRVPDAHEPASHDPILVPLVCTGGQGTTFVAKPEAASSGRLFLCPVSGILNFPLRAGGLSTARSRRCHNQISM